MTDIITKKEWINIFPEAREYLENELDFQIKKFELQKEIFLNQLKINELKKLDSDSKDFADIMTDIFDGEDLKETEKRIKEIYQYIRKETSTNGITEQDKEQAREYPFDNLIKFNNAGFALCPFHKEKTPSLHLNKKNNKVHCFGCNKTWDTIQFLIDNEDLNFVQAVKVLK
jgi:hypothetical protein